LIVLCGILIFMFTAHGSLRAEGAFLRETVIAGFPSSGVDSISGYAETVALSETAHPVRVHVDEQLARLLAEEDTDGDGKLTVADTVVGGNRGDGRFQLVGLDGIRYEVAGTYNLSNLLEELTIASVAGSTVVSVAPALVFENPVHRISRLIGEVYWDALTRRIDGDHLREILPDEKLETGAAHYLYVPYTDTIAFAYFRREAGARPDPEVRVERLPEDVTPEYVRSLGERHGILSLELEQIGEGKFRGKPFVVPGGRFNEMYGWDSYFIVLGLLADGRVELARAMVDNFVYQIDHYHQILNANRTYYLTRSQPPFLTSMALAVYEHMEKGGHAKYWLRGVIAAAIREYHEVWMGISRLTGTGLSRYFGSGIGPPPEVEPGHFDPIYRPYAEALGLPVREYERRYRAGEIREPALDTFFVHDRAVRESGHDTSYRFDRNGSRCADLVTVDLNSLLYKIEIDIARMLEHEFGGKLAVGGVAERAVSWYERARKRRELINTYLWDEERGMYFDYDTVAKRRSGYVSATTFYPLWACHADHDNARLASPRQAALLVQNALPLLEAAGGIAASALKSRGPLSGMRQARQWDYPYGWAPHQMLVWRGLLNYQYDEPAVRLVYKWLYTITKNAVDYSGMITEKYNVVICSHEVFAEYGNVGVEFDYITREGFGWTNASYRVGCGLLPAALRERLGELVPPEDLFVP
jgi:alpha,alpha-trehalase